MLLEDPKGPFDRELYSLAAGTALDLAANIEISPGHHFVLFLAWDARTVPDDTVIEVARDLVRKGLAYIVAWGPDCERVHDLFDLVDMAENPESTSASPDTVIMSTWHDDETMEEALWFALFNAWPAVPYDETCSAAIAATVANSSWADSIHKYLGDLPSLNRAVGL